MEMLKLRKQQLEERGVKGFTLMEMLIVIAIIAVLVAIAIPVFGAQLAKANAETDAANIRSGYATVTATVLTNNVTDNKTYYLNTDGTVTEGTTSVTEGSYKCKGSSDDMPKDSQVGNIAVKNKDEDATDKLQWTTGNGIKYTYDSAKNKVTISTNS